MKRCDRLVFGGGTLIQNVTSRRSLFYYTALMRLARRYGVPVEILAGGIGRVSGMQRKCVRKCLETASLTLRTPLDIASLAALSPTAEASLLPDLVFSLPNFHQEKKRSGIAVSLRGREPSPALLECLMRVKQMRGEELFFIPMSPKDILISRRAAAMTGGIYRHFEKADELFSFLSSICYAVGMRLHFLIFALRVGCCPVSLAYDEKGDKFASFVNETLQNKLILTVDKKSERDLSVLYERLLSPPPTELVKEADRCLSIYYENEENEA